MYNFIEMSLPSLFKIAAISFQDSTTGRTTLKVPLRKTHTPDASINYVKFMFLSSPVDTHMEHDTQNA